LVLTLRGFMTDSEALQVFRDTGAALAAKLARLGAVTVIAPAMGGLVIGQEVARQLRVRFIFAEKEEGKLVLRRGFKIASGERLLVVEDVVTKGGRVQETMDIVRALGGVVAGVGMAVNRSNGTVDLGVPTFSLLKMNVERGKTRRMEGRRRVDGYSFKAIRSPKVLAGSSSMPSGVSLPSRFL
jgi:orotate phosphoribosyltransferase